MAEDNNKQYIPKLNPQIVLMGYLNSNAKDVGQLAGYLAGSNKNGN